MPRPSHPSFYHPNNIWSITLSFHRFYSQMYFSAPYSQTPSVYIPLK
jgi:hypothetical protein